MRRFILMVAMHLSTLGMGAAYAQTTAPALSPEAAERVTQARARVEAMQDRVTRLEQSMDQARADKDIVKLNYLSDKIKSLKGLLKVSVQSEKNLGEALARHDVSAANHEEEKMAIAEAKSEALFEQSQSAVGHSTVFSGKTQVELSINEKLAGSSTANPVKMMLTPPPAAVVINLRPPAASPYQ